MNRRHIVLTLLLASVLALVIPLSHAGLADAMLIGEVRTKQTLAGCRA